MKTTLLSLLTATLLGLASLASGRHFDAADFTAIMFTTGLVAWTIDQYSREPRVLKRRPKPYALLNKPRHQYQETPHRSRWHSRRSN